MYDMNKYVDEFLFWITFNQTGRALKPELQNKKTGVMRKKLKPWNDADSLYL